MIFASMRTENTSAQTSLHMCELSVLVSKLAQKYQYDEFTNVQASARTRENTAHIFLTPICVLSTLYLKHTIQQVVEAHYLKSCMFLRISIFSYSTCVRNKVSLC